MHEQHEDEGAQSKAQRNTQQPFRCFCRTVCRRRRTRGEQATTSEKSRKKDSGSGLNMEGDVVVHYADVEWGKAKTDSDASDIEGPTGKSGTAQAGRVCTSTTMAV